jgi:hypothetical protein
MTTEAYSFYSVGFYDEATGFSLHEAYLEDFDENGMPDFIREKIDDVNVNESSPLDRARFVEHPILEAAARKWDKLPIRLTRESSELPYRVHGGRELDLMLKGVKPLSVFSHVETPSNLARFLTKYFEPLVECGMLVSAKIDDDGSVAPTLMFALPGEAWRFEAYRLMADAARATNWNDALERIEGALLGYSSEQNNYWISHRKRKGYRWGSQTAYRLLPDAEIEFIKRTGRKAFRFDDSPVRLYLPHETHGRNDPREALANIWPGALARFCFPMVKFMEFSRGVARHADVDFDVFEIPNAELPRLNELIDGTIDLIRLS